jgi:hypothetical protein
MGPLLYMRFVVDRNVVMLRIPVLCFTILYAEWYNNRTVHVN